MHTASAAAPSTRPLILDLLRFARDFAGIGFGCGGVAPLAGALYLRDLGPYALASAALALASGPLVGIAVGLAVRVPPRSLAALFAALAGPLVLGVWGAAVAGGALGIAGPHDIPLWLVLPCGGAAGALQGAWILPVYLGLAHRGAARWPVVLGSALASPFCGLFGVWVALALAFPRM